MADREIVKALKRRERELTSELKRVGRALSLVSAEVKRRKVKRKKKEGAGGAAPAIAEAAASAAAAAPKKARKKKGGKPGIANAANDAVGQDTALDEREEKRKRAEELRKK